jgi:hypothetical protein
LFQIAKQEREEGPGSTWDGITLSFAGMRRYLNKWLQPAVNKPSIGDFSPSHGMLVLVLCVLSMEMGVLMAEGVGRSSGNVLNLVVAGALLINTLGSGFRWSAITTVCLRAAAAGWVGLMFVALFFWR